MTRVRGEYAVTRVRGEYAVTRVRGEWSAGMADGHTEPSSRHASNKGSVVVT